MLTSILLIENLCDNSLILCVANAVLRTQKLREESWVQKDKSEIHSEYSSSYFSCAELACTEFNLDKFWISIMVHLNEHYWNDIQSWAEQKIEELDVKI